VQTNNATGIVQLAAGTMPDVGVHGRVVF